MTIQDIEQRLHNGVWSILPEKKCSLKASIASMTMADFNAPVMATSASVDNAYGTNVVIPVHGV